MRRLILGVVAGLAVTAIPAQGAGPTVAVKDFKFAPASLTVRHGTVVTFRFAGKAPHNVTAKSGPTRFHSPTKKSGTYSYRFAKKGTYRLVCTIHPGMAMKLVVK